jgi:hypothetical protein
MHPGYGFCPAGSQLPLQPHWGREREGHQMLDVLHESSSIEVFGDVALCYTNTHAHTRALFFPKVYSQRHRGFTICTLYPGQPSLGTLGLCWVTH